MGTIKQGANGGFSGKAGSVVGSSWKDINYIKGLSKARTKPASQLQLEQQAKFARAIKFLRPIKDLLNVTFGHLKAGRATGFNMALKQVIKFAIEGDYPDYGINYPAVVLSDGGLAIAIGSVSIDSERNLHVKWNPTLNPYNGFIDDVITILFYDPQTNIFQNVAEVNTRPNGEALIPLREELIGHTLQVYYFFTGRGKQLSPSYYAGHVEVV